jgi:hypothetical protein
MVSVATAMPWMQRCGWWILLCLLTLRALLYDLFYVTVHLDPPNILAKAFILDAPGCPPCNSSRIRGCPCFGISTRLPHRMQSSMTDNSSRLCQYGFKASSACVGHPSLIHLNTFADLFLST